MKRFTKAITVLLAVLLLTIGFAGAVSANEITDSVSSSMSVAKVISAVGAGVITGGFTVAGIIDAAAMGLFVSEEALPFVCMAFGAGAAASAAFVAATLAAVATIAAAYGGVKYIINHKDDIKAELSKFLQWTEENGGIDPAEL